MSTTSSGADLKARTAEDIRGTVGDLVDPPRLAELQQQAASADTSYGANGSVWSGVIYMGWQVQVTGGKTFNGRSWGIAFPGGGALFGDVYTDDIGALYANTDTFAFTATPVYTALYFYDSDHNLLGHFQAGSVSIVTGVGGGSGSWS